MNFELKNDLLNLPSLQLTMDRIVFEHIDTLPNWSKAYEMLNELLQKVVINFNAAINKKDGKLPKASTYWVPFMDIAAKLLYFTALAKSHLIDEQDVESKGDILKHYYTSYSCLPNASIEENEELLNEIQKSINALALKADQPIDIKISKSFDECVLQFGNFVKNYR